VKFNSNNTYACSQTASTMRFVGMTLVRVALVSVLPYAAQWERVIDDWKVVQNCGIIFISKPQQTTKFVTL
jgi:hypothetical protein